METPQSPLPHGLPTTLISREERDWAMYAHLSALVGLLVPFGNLLLPFIILKSKSDMGPFFQDNAKAALNFQLTCFLIGLVCALLVFIGIGIPLLVLLGIFNFAMPIVSAIKAGEGKPYNYPVLWKLLR